ncbi:hypothetical protein OPQ81_011114 [Rhizoctonia solani]|nr:hypothetical protein OPQ81_011114 [Rhizoctonia solani]
MDKHVHHKQTLAGFVTLGKLQHPSTSAFDNVYLPQEYRKMPDFHGNNRMHAERHVAAPLISQARSQPLARPLDHAPAFFFHPSCYPTLSESLTLGIESMLEESMKILQSHEKILHTHQYNTFSIKHHRLQLKVIEIKKYVQDQQKGEAPIQDTYDSELARIYDQTEIYHRDVITASRRAQLDQKNRLRAAEETETPPDTTWYSVITPQSSSSSDSDTVSDTSTLVDREPFVAVAHVRENKLIDGLNYLEDDAYRRIIILESKEKRMIMIDPNPCYLDKEANPMNESTLIEMSRAGETLLRAKEPDNLKGYETVGESEQPSWIDSLIDTMARLGAGVNTTTV